MTVKDTCSKTIDGFQFGIWESIFYRSVSVILDNLYKGKFGLFGCTKKIADKADGSHTDCSGQALHLLF